MQHGRRVERSVAAAGRAHRASGTPAEAAEPMATSWAAELRSLLAPPANACSYVSARLSPSPLSGCAWFRGWRAPPPAGQCGTRCALWQYAWSPGQRPAATAPVFFVFAEQCQCNRHSAPAAQITASPAFEPRATPLPLSALNYHPTDSTWRNPLFGGGTGDGQPKPSLLALVGLLAASTHRWLIS